MVSYHAVRPIVINTITCSRMYNSILNDSKNKLHQLDINLFSFDNGSTISSDLSESWKTHPEKFPKFKFPGSAARPYWKTHPFLFRNFNFGFTSLTVHCIPGKLIHANFIHFQVFVKYYLSTESVVLDEFSRNQSVSLLKILKLASG